MKNRSVGNPLSISPYLEAIAAVESQFSLIRFALKNLSKAKIQAFFKRQLDEELSSLDSYFQELDPQNEIGVKDYLSRYLKKEHRKKHRPGDIRFHVEFLEDRLNQSELLLLVAHFESFMKEIHETFLTAAPAKVFGARGQDAKVYASRGL